MNNDQIPPVRLNLPPRKTVDVTPAIGIAQVATEAMLGVQVGAWKIEEIERQCRQSVYWPQFCQLTKAGVVPEDWIPGALGRVVIGWAKKEAL